MYEPCDGMHPGSYFCCHRLRGRADEAGKTDCEGTENGTSGGRNDAMQPVVMLVIAGVAMFSVIGGVSLLSHYYTLNGIKSRTVGDGQHGTARFATKKEIAETYVQVPYEPELWRRGENLPAAQGLVLGSMERAGKLYALVDTGDVHCLMIGAAGVGKTAHFLYPNIEYACACGMSLLTTDTKGDLYRNYAGIAKNTMATIRQSSISVIRPEAMVTICSIWSTNTWMSILQTIRT